MTAKLSKRQKAMSALYDRGKHYKLDEALDILKSAAKNKFDETVELAMSLTLNSKNPADIVRGTAVLPHGTGKTVRVAVFCKGENEKKARDEGAEFIGSDELIKKISAGWCDFDVAIAETGMMREIARLGKILGPRGLMPNPKTGTVTDDIAKAVKDVRAGKIEFKMDKQSGLHAGVGKISFSKEALRENIKKLLSSILSSNPAMARPHAIKSVTISRTMGPGLKLDVSEFRS